MGRIETYQRRQRMPMGAPAVPISKWDEYALTAEQQAMAGFGQAVGNIGLDVLQRIEKSEIDRQLSDYEVKKDTFWNEYALWVTQNPNQPDLDLSELNRRIKEQKNDLFSGLTRSEARKRAEMEFNEAVAEWSGKAKDQAYIAAVKNQETALKVNYETITSELGREINQKELNERIAKMEALVDVAARNNLAMLHVPEVAEAMKAAGRYKITYNNIWEVAKKILRTDGVKAAQKYIKENEVLSDTHKRQRLSWLNVVAESERTSNEQLLRTEKKEIWDDIRARHPDVYRRIQDSEVLLPDEKTTLSEAVTQSFKQEPTMNWRAYLDLEGELMDYYREPTEQKRHDLSEKIGQIRYTDKKITTEWFDELTARLDTQYPSYLIGPIAEARVHGYRTIGAWFEIAAIDRTVEPRWLGKKKLEKIAHYNRALIAWLETKKKEIQGEMIYDVAPEDVYIQSRILANFYRQTDDLELPKADRIRVEAPPDEQGNRVMGTIPRDKKDTAIEKGYRIIEE